MRPPHRILHLFFFFSFCLPCAATLLASTNNWSTMSPPFRPVNVAASGGAIWVCGADEMILSSRDGGGTWETKHEKRDGEVLLNISFVNGEVGHAAGTDGLLLSTDDGGQSWKKHTAPGSVRAFSFADSTNGIAVLSNGSPQPSRGSLDQARVIDGVAKITQDGGDHWEDVTALDSDELRPFAQILAVAALDSSHYLMLRRQPNVEDVFVVTKDGGKSWKLDRPQNDATNRALPRMVLVHQGEYWAFGEELIHRGKGGGYSVPLVLHSKDGETWTHGVNGAEEFTTCNAQGCYLWDGAVESLYGEHEQFWSLPQDGSLSEKWAIAGTTACTVGSTLKCGHATISDKPAERSEPPGGIIFLSPSHPHFADGCLECGVDGIVPDSAGPPSMRPVHASVMVRRDGTVANVSVDHPSSKRLTNIIADQLSKWLFEPTHSGVETIEAKKDISMYLMCSGIPGRPETDRCTLHPSDEFSRPGQLTTTSTTVKQ
ncbi:MAG: YCF48-related protein [Terriglobales bacterium]